MGKREIRQSDYHPSYREKGIPEDVDREKLEIGMEGLWLNIRGELEEAINLYEKVEIEDLIAQIEHIEGLLELINMVNYSTQEIQELKNKVSEHKSKD